MKLLLALLLNLGLLLPLVSQDFQINWGKEDKGQETIGKITTLGWHENHFYTFRVDPTGMNNYTYHLEKIDDSLRLVFSKKLDFKNISRTLPILRDGKIIVYQAEAKESGKKYIKISSTEIDLEGNLGKSKEIGIIDSIQENLTTSGSHKVAISQNKKYLGLCLAEAMFKDDLVKIHNLVIDLDSNTQYLNTTDTFSIAKKDNRVNVADVVVLNDGRIVNIVGTQRIKTKTYTNITVDPYTYKMVILDSNQQYLEPQNLMVEDIYFDQVKLRLIHDKLFMNGFLLTRKKKKEMHNGIFLAQINLDSNRVENIKPFAYSEDFFESIGYKVQGNGDAKFSGYFNLELAATESGEGYILADHIERLGTENNPIYSFYELIAIPFDSTGELGEQIVVPKRLNTTGKHENGGDYFSFSRDDTLYLVYNDHIKNLEITDHKKLKDNNNVNANSIATIIVSLTEGKELSRKVLFSYKEDGGYLLEDKCFVEGETVLLNKANGKKTTYGRLEFKQMASNEEMMEEESEEQELEEAEEQEESNSEEENDQEEELEGEMSPEEIEVEDESEVEDELEVQEAEEEEAEEKAEEEESEEPNEEEEEDPKSTEEEGNDSEDDDEQE